MNSYTHAPENYTCPICLGIQGVENEATLICSSDIVFKDDLVTAFIGSFSFGDTVGNILVVPNSHFENVYDLSRDCAERITDISQKIAKAIKEVRKCNGVTMLQNNEPAGGQHAFHYHLHIFPRFEGDKWETLMWHRKSTTKQEREQYSTPLREYLKQYD